MNVDLHCHSHFSDGKHSPDFLIQKAIEKKLSHLAITDHDCTYALRQIQVKHSELTVINGVEISCGWENQEVHIVGLFIDPEHESIRKLLDSQQLQRRLRLHSISDKLTTLGITGLVPYIEGLRCISYTRSHAADLRLKSATIKCIQ